MFDSLHHQLSIVESDSIKQLLYLDLSWEYSFSDVDTARYFAEEGIKLAVARDNVHDLASSKEMLAIIYDINGSIEKAAELFLEVAEYYENQNAFINLSSTYNNLGTLFFNNDEIIKASEYYTKSMEIDMKIGDSLGVASSLINLASIANRNRNYLLGYKYLLRGKRIVEQRPDPWSERAIYDALGSSHNYQNNFDSSAYYYHLLLPLSREDGDVSAESSCLAGLAQAYFGLKDYKRSVEYFKQAEEIDYPDVYFDRNLKNIGSDLYAQMGDYKRAYEYQTSYIAAVDSIAKGERIQRINELEQKYRTEQQGKEIAELEIANQKSRNQRNLIFFTTIFVVLGAIFLYVLLRAKSKSNQLISKSLSEKETLLKEIHHRVKNNLQVISSLLSLQSRYIKNEAAQAAVNEGQNRVKSMALIHQKLYQKDNLMGVEVFDYIQNLTSALRATYGIEHDRVEINYDVMPANIDVDTIIPIGLIINELVSNSFKHAFPDGKEGALFIGLKEKESKLELIVKDNGVGSTRDIEKSESFGMRMIDSLSKKLEADVAFDFSNGSSASLTISNYKLV